MRGASSVSADEERERARSLPLSTYSAVGGLRQDPGRAAQSPITIKNHAISDRSYLRESPDDQRVRPARAAGCQGRPGTDRRGRAAFRRDRREPRRRDRRPVRAARRGAPGAGRDGPEGAGSRHGGTSAHRSPARPASFRARSVPGADGQRRRPRAGVRRPARAHRQRRSAVAGRLALPRRGTLLRRDARQPDGTGQPTPLSLDARTHQRLLGRGVHARRIAGARRRPRRPVGVHRQPRR